MLMVMAMTKFNIESSLKDEELQNNLFSVRREISFSTDKPKTVIIGFKDGLSKKDVKKFRDMLMSGLTHDPKIHKVILMSESQFNSVIETKKEVNIYINGEKYAIND